MDFSQIILTPFSWLLTFFHSFSNYGIALILFAIVVKLILFPFSLKSKRSMIQMNLIQGKVQQIQKQYARNREKMNEEIQKLYAKEKVNPMGGCLWSLIPLFILWPLYAIIRRPLYHLMHQSEAAIEAIAKVLNFSAESVGRSAAYSELYMANMINEGNIDAVRAAVEGVSAGMGDKLFIVDFNFLGMNLAEIAQWKIWTVSPLTWGAIGLFLLPIISAVLSLLMSKVSQATNAMSNKQAAQQSSQMKSMMIMMPLMSLWIGYAMPAGLCVYWIINSLTSMVQEFISGKMLKKDYERAAAARAEQERLEKEEEKRKKREAAERRAKAIEEAKNNKGKKKKPVEETEKKKDRTTDVGRIGMRPYARGRSYDPDRFGGVTPYQDPGAPIDEEAVAQALLEKGALPEEEPVVEAPVEEVVQDTAEVTDAAEPVEAEETEAEVEEPAEESESEDEDEQPGE